MFRKFGPNDILLNTMRATPRSHFFIYNSKIYYNNEPEMSSSLGGGSQVTTLQLNAAGDGPVPGYMNIILGVHQAHLRLLRMMVPSG